MKNWKKTLLKLVILTAVLAWVAVGATFYLEVDRSIGIMVVTVAAFATEAVIWTSALVLGVTVFESRRRIWARLTGRKIETGQNEG